MLRISYQIFYFHLLIIHLSNGYQQYFRIRPTNTAITVGKDIELPCNVGNRAGSVQWSKDGFLLGFDKDIPGFPRHSMLVQKDKGVFNLLIKTVQVEDEGLYQCQVGPTEDQKGIRTGANVTVLVAPKDVFITSMASFLSKLTNIRSPGVDKGKNNERSMRLSDNDGEIDSTKVSMNAQWDQNRAKQTDHVTTIKAKEGETVTLECIVPLSKPEAQLTWFRNNVQLPKDKHTLIIEDGLGSSARFVTTKSFLEVFITSDEEGALYFCNINHPALEAAFNVSTQISVLVPPGLPEIQGYISGYPIRAGQSITLTCIADKGNPPGVISWKKLNNTLEATKVSSDEKRIKSSLTFETSPVDNNVSIYCEAKNEVITDSHSTNVHLNVQYPPINVRINGPSSGKFGENVTLFCVAGPSNPAMNIEWKADGKKIETHSLWTEEVDIGWISKSNLTLTIREGSSSPVFVECQGIHELFEEHTAMGHIVQIIRPPGVPIIRGYDSNSFLVEGDLLRLECISIGGNPLATLRWFRQTDAFQELHSKAWHLDGSSVAEVTIKVKPSDNEASYICEALNGGLVYPLVATVKLNVSFIAKSVHLQVNPTSPKEGEIVTVICDVGPCLPMCSLELTKRGRFSRKPVIFTHLSTQVTRADSSGVYTKATANLTVSSQIDHSFIVCSASNRILNTNIKSTQFLTVLYKPYFVAPILQKVTVIEGYAIFINMTAKANPSHIVYTWYKSGIVLSDDSTKIDSASVDQESLGSNSNRNTSLISLNGPLLRIDNVCRTDQSEFDVEAVNSVGTAKATIILNVLFSATINRLSNEVFGNPGETLVISCEAFGNPMDEHTVNWSLKEGLSDDFTQSVFIRKEKGKAILQISKFHKYHTGTYKCEAFNGIQEPDVKPVKLMLNEKPQIVETSRYVIASEGDDIIINCTATAVPNVIFKWLDQDGELMSRTNGVTNRDFHFVIGQTKVRSENKFVFQTSLFLEYVKPDRFKSKLRCLAINPAGEDFLDIELRLKGKPDPPSNVTITFINHNSVQVSFTPQFDGGYLQTFLAFYSPVINDEQRKHIKYSKPIGNSRETNSNQILINGLEESAEYEISVLAKNVFGESNFSEPIVFRTKAAVLMATNQGSVHQDDSSRGLLQIMIQLATIAVGFIVVLINVIFAFHFVRRRVGFLLRKDLPYEDSIKLGINNLNVGYVRDFPENVQESDLTKLDLADKLGCDITRESCRESECNR